MWETFWGVSHEDVPLDGNRGTDSGRSPQARSSPTSDGRRYPMEDIGIWGLHVALGSLFAAHFSREGEPRWYTDKTSTSFGRLNPIHRFVGP